MSICGPSRPRVQATSARAAVATLRRLRRSRGRCVHHDRARVDMGHPAGRRTARAVGEPLGDGAALRAVLQRERSAHRGATVGLASPSVPPSRPLPLSGRGDHAPARGGPPPTVCHRPAASHICHALRSVRSHRPAGQRAIATRRDDVDLVNGVLTVRGTKFGKSRYVPLHPTTRRALQRYASRRDRCCHDLETPSFFVSDRGTRLTGGACGGLRQVVA
jgi:integrase